MVNPKRVARPVPDKFRVQLAHNREALFMLRAVFTNQFSTTVRQGDPILAFD